tara:strand:- start:6705 stop:7259 length:555 start_codon:yes stop_codon:yes gene_type:complete
MSAKNKSMSASEWRSVCSDSTLFREPKAGGRSIKDVSLGDLQREILDRRPLISYSSTDLMNELRERGIKTKTKQGEFVLVPNKDNKVGLENGIVIETCREFGIRPNGEALRGRGDKGAPNLARKVVCYLSSELGVDRELIRVMLHYASSDTVSKNSGFIRDRVQTDVDLLKRIANIYNKLKLEQ